MHCLKTCIEIFTLWPKSLWAKIIAQFLISGLFRQTENHKLQSSRPVFYFEPDYTVKEIHNCQRQFRKCLKLGNVRGTLSFKKILKFNPKIYVQARNFADIHFVSLMLRRLHPINIFLHFLMDKILNFVFSSYFFNDLHHTISI